MAMIESFAQAAGSSSQPAPHGKYLYAIAMAQKERSYDVVGVDGAAVYTVAYGGAAAVVSDCARRKIRPERAHLAAHQEVLRRLTLETTVLPMAFGIIADDLKAVQRMLALNHRAFLEQLTRLEGSVEMGLRVIWDVPNIFEYFIDHHPALRAARDRLLGGNREPPQEAKIELGRFFEQLLTEVREEHLATIEERLAPCCEALEALPLRQVQEAVKLSLLVKRSQQQELEEAVFAAARLFDQNYAFDLNGPWAPHNFVELNLQLNSSDPVEHYAAH